MQSSPQVALLVAFIALLGALLNALVLAINARKRGDVDKELVELKSRLDKINAESLAENQASINTRLKRLEFDQAKQSAEDERKRVADAETLISIKKEIQSSSMVEFLRQHDFSNNFDGNELVSLRRFLFTAQGADGEFLNSTLEKLRKHVVMTGQQLDKLISEKTHPRPGGGTSVLPTDFMSGERPEWVKENAEELNKAAKAFTEAFDNLVRQSRRTLGN